MSEYVSALLVYLIGLTFFFFLHMRHWSYTWAPSCFLLFHHKTKLINIAILRSCFTERHFSVCSSSIHSPLSSYLWKTKAGHLVPELITAEITISLFEWLISIYQHEGGGVTGGGWAVTTETESGSGLNVGCVGSAGVVGRRFSRGDHNNRFWAKRWLFLCFIQVFFFLFMPLWIGGVSRLFSTGGQSHPAEMTGDLSAGSQVLCYFVQYVKWTKIFLKVAVTIYKQKPIFFWAPVQKKTKKAQHYENKKQVNPIFETFIF